LRPGKTDQHQRPFPAWLPEAARRAGT
jgi:hypothetical protein